MSIPTASLGGANVAAYRDIPFDAADFTGVGGPGGGTWTVDAGDVTEWQLAVVGEIAFMRLTLVNTAVATAAVTSLHVTNPFNTGAVTQFIAHVKLGTGALETAFVSAGSGAMVISRSNGSDFSVGAVGVWLHGTFPIVV